MLSENNKKLQLIQKYDLKFDYLRNFYVKNNFEISAQKIDNNSSEWLRQLLSQNLEEKDNAE